MVALAHTETPMTADAFLDALPRLGPGKHALVDGVVYSMAPASPTHAVIQANLALVDRLRIEAGRCLYQHALEC